MSLAYRRESHWVLAHLLGRDCGVNVTHAGRWRTLSKRSLISLLLVDLGRHSIARVLYECPP